MSLSGTGNLQFTASMVLIYWSEGKGAGLNRNNEIYKYLYTLCSTKIKRPEILYIPLWK
jgi:hypothetical protein